MDSNPVRLAIENINSKGQAIVQMAQIVLGVNPLPRQHSYRNIVQKRQQRQIRYLLRDVRRLGKLRRAARELRIKRQIFVLPRLDLQVPKLRDQRCCECNEELHVLQTGS